MHGGVLHGRFVVGHRGSAFGPLKIVQGKVIRVIILEILR
jgi:hypothetical protein